MRRVILFMAIAATAFGLMLYPSALNWFGDRALMAVSSEYSQAASRVSAPQRDEVLQAAEAYNEVLAHTYDVQYRAEDAATDPVYNSLLNIGDTTLMGEVVIPSLEVRLGIYHGVTDEVLDLGAGHIYGTSLPVGGPSTHAAISAHTGYAKTEMFGRLHELQLGDEFYITTAGRTLRYVVDDIRVVLPSETEALNIIPDEDHVTLVTCTPIGINSHRLLVRGVRAELPLGAGLIGVPDGVGFPWWAVQYAAGLTGAALLAAVVEKGRKKLDARPITGTIPLVSSIVAIGLLAGATVFGAADSAQAMDIPVPLPGDFPLTADSGTLTIIKRAPAGETPSQTTFLVQQVLSIGGQTVDLTQDAAWTMLANFDVDQLNTATLGPVLTEASDSEGEASLTLPVGLYYVSETDDISLIGDPHWRINPFLVTVPLPDVSGWYFTYNIVAEPKIHDPAVPIPTPSVPTIPDLSPQVNPQANPEINAQTNPLANPQVPPAAATRLGNLLSRTGVWLGPIVGAVIAISAGTLLGKRKAGEAR